MGSREQQQPRQEQAPPPPPRSKQVARSKQRSRVPRARPPIRVLVSRGYTIIALLTTLILPFTLKNTNKETGVPPPEPARVKAASKVPPSPSHKTRPPPNRAPPPDPQPPFNLSGTVGSVLAASLLGAGCNLFQLGMLIYCMLTGKDWTSSKFNLFFNYYIDKAVALLLAANAGVGLGSTLTIMQVKKLRPLPMHIKQLPELSLSSFKTMRLEEISTALLASAAISTSVSSTCSAEAIHDYMRAVEKGEKAVGILGRLAAKAYNCCCGP